MSKDKLNTIETTETREELVNKYFDGLPSYKMGNMSIVSLLSDLQTELQMGLLAGRNAQHYAEILNDIKRILITDSHNQEKR